MRLFVHKSVKQLFLLSLSTTTYLYATPEIEACGQGYDSLHGTLKESPFMKIKCKLNDTKHPYFVKIKFIENYSDLFTFLDIPKNKKFFKNYWTQKLLNNQYINDYTITLAQLEEFTLYQNLCTNTLINKEQNLSHEVYGDSYIKNIDVGARHLTLYHIQTHSQNEYRSIRKKISRLLPDTDKLKKFLLSQNKKVIYKEYFSKELPAIPANDLNTTFIQTKYFIRTTKSNPLPYKFGLKYYQPADKAYLSVKKPISTALTLQYQLNNYIYYRRHTNEFKPLQNNINTLYEQQSDLKRNLRIIKRSYKDLNISSNFHLPTRYQHYANNTPLSLKKEQIILHTTTQYKKINPTLKLKLELFTKLQIKNNHKLLRMENTLHYKLEHETQKTKKSNIVCDTYVNYPGLRLESVKNNFGSLEVLFDFNKYNQEKAIEGSGIIKSATCGYKLKKNGKLDIYCKDIQYRENEIKLKHKQQ